MTCWFVHHLACTRENILRGSFYSIASPRGKRLLKVVDTDTWAAADCDQVLRDDEHDVGQSDSVTAVYDHELAQNEHEAAKGESEHELTDNEHVAGGETVEGPSG